MTTPEVAVVVPMRDAAETIAETIDSVARQERAGSAVELLVVDDGSTDGSGRIACAAMDRHGLAGRLLACGPAAGPSAARNAGWRATDAPWIQFLDADDLLGPDKVARQLNAATSAPANVAVVHSAWARLEWAQGGWRRGSDVIDPLVGQDDPLLDLLRPDNVLHTGSALFRRSALARVDGFDERLWLLEDVELLMRLARDGGGFLRVPVAEPQFWYRRRAGSLSRRDDRAFIDACLRNADWAERVWTADGPLTGARRKALAAVYGQAARFHAAHDSEQFERLVRRLEQLDPGYAPAEPAGLRRLSRLVGYRAAERLAVRYRTVRRLIAGRG